MGRHKPIKAAEIFRTDMSTLLGCLASDLRNAGLAVRGLDCGRPEPGGEESRDLDRLVSSLDRVASTLEAVRDHLCPDWALRGVAEQIRFDGSPCLKAK